MFMKKKKKKLNKSLIYLLKLKNYIYKIINIKGNSRLLNIYIFYAIK